MPHGYCLLWRPDLVALHAAADTTIALSYFGIPAALATLAKRRPDILPGPVAMLFIGFITACGLSHLVSLWTLWVPAYGLEGLVKAGTAGVSGLTAISLWMLMPRALALPSQAQLRESNTLLEAEIAQRNLVEVHLREARNELERRVAERTQELAEANTRLVRENEIRRGTERRLREEQERTHALAFHDPLTGLANRALFQDRLDHAIAQRRRDGGKAAVLLVDVDHFKGVNDRYGHPMGDALLMAIANRIRALVRESDTVARIGGDEFAVVMTDAGSQERPHEVGRRIVDAVAVEMEHEGQQLRAGCSVGTATFPDDADGSTELMRLADVALYGAKARGRGNVGTYDFAMALAERRRRLIADGLNVALERDALTLHYQPIFDLRTGSIIALEALVRWPNADVPGIGPAEFIPIAESCGLINVLGDWALDRATKQLADWHRRGMDVAISVNASTLQLLRGDFAQSVAGALERSGVQADRLWIEITETGPINEPHDRLASQLDELGRLGVQLAIDDFGTGSSSLARLQGGDFAILKIDGLFVGGIGEDGGNETIVRTLLDLAAGLGRTAVAERIETPEQLSFLQDHCCPYGQGFLLAPPEPAEHVFERLHRQPQRLIA